MSTLWMVLRFVDVFLYCGIVSGLIMHWRVLRIDRLPGFRVGLVGLFASLTYGVVELVFLQQPGGPRLVPVTAFLAVLFGSFYLRSVQRIVLLVRRRRPVRGGAS